MALLPSSECHAFYDVIVIFFLMPILFIDSPLSRQWLARTRIVTVLLSFVRCDSYEVEMIRITMNKGHQDRILSNKVQKIRITSNIGQKDRILSNEVQKIRITLFT